MTRTQGHHGAVADWDGRAYRHVSDLQQWLATQSLAGISMDGNERVLDVGCGDGRITAAIADQLPEGSIIGIDPSPRMVQTALSLTGEAPARLRFEVGDVLTMGFRGEFDAVVSFNALHWVLDQRGALTRIRDAMRESGWALLQFVCHGERPSLEQVAMQVAVSPSWRAYFAGFEAPFVHVDPARYAAIAATARLVPVDVEVKDRSWDFGNRVAFTRWCRVGFDAWTSRLPDNGAADGFVADVVTAYSAITGTTHRVDFMQMRARLVPQTE